LYLLLMNVGNPGRLPLIDAKPRAGLARWIYYQPWSDWCASFSLLNMNSFGYREWVSQAITERHIKRLCLPPIDFYALINCRRYLNASRRLPCWINWLSFVCDFKSNRIC
jgi:hypothetical protein